MTFLIEEADAIQASWGMLIFLTVIVGLCLACLLAAIVVGLLVHYGVIKHLPCPHHHHEEGEPCECHHEEGEGGEGEVLGAIDIDTKKILDAIKGLRTEGVVAAAIPASEGGVTFATSVEKKTYVQRVDELPKEERKLYDALIAHIHEKEGIKESMTTSTYKIKMKAYPLVKFTFKRGGLVALINVHNQALNGYIGESNVKVNETEVAVKALDDYQMISELIDVADAEIHKDLERKAEERREKRRLARAAAKAAQ
ncbi:MAG: hypothetical protein LUB56_03290 [Coprobacillus sp.]|nr:hypothetical protein [Coprobacillus sp.]